MRRIYGEAKNELTKNITSAESALKSKLNEREKEFIKNQRSEEELLISDK